MLKIFKGTKKRQKDKKNIVPKDKHGCLLTCGVSMPKGTTKETKPEERQHGCWGGNLSPEARIESEGRWRDGSVRKVLL